MPTIETIQDSDPVPHEEAHFVHESRLKPRNQGLRAMNSVLDSAVIFLLHHKHNGLTILFETLYEQIL